MLEIVLDEIGTMQSLSYTDVQEDGSTIDITTEVIAHHGYRQLFIKNYVIVFRVDEGKKQVVIVTVQYAKRLF